MPAACLPPNRDGFTLVELLVTLTIACLLLGLAVPNFVHFLQQIQLSTAVSGLRSAINLTRSEAIKRNGKVDLVAVNGNWANGWIIKSAENDQILSHEALDKDFNISAKFTDGDQHISYNGSGHSRTKKGTSTPQSGHIQISIGKNSRLIVINFLGRVRVCNPANEPNCVTNSSDE
jgi:type IV fimbrial biogenesis protein FimT